MLVFVFLIDYICLGICIGICLDICLAIRLGICIVICIGRKGMSLWLRIGKATNRTGDEAEPKAKL